MSGRMPPPNGSVHIVPSLLAADFAELGRAARQMERAGARWVQVDVMDGHFVPNLSFGPDHVKWLKARTRMALDAHLMVERPERFIRPFVDAGADLVTVHVEACPRPGRVLKAIRRAGVRAGLAVRPRTPAGRIVPYLKHLDLALVMTVEPGFGGQAFLPDMLSKVRLLRRAIDRLKAPCWLQVDGGINAQTGELAAAAGADSLVAGSSIFRAPDPARAFRSLARRARLAASSRLASGQKTL